MMFSDHPPLLSPLPHTRTQAEQDVELSVPSGMDLPSTFDDDEVSFESLLIERAVRCVRACVCVHDASVCVLVPTRSCGRAWVLTAHASLHINPPFRPLESHAHTLPPPPHPLTSASRTYTHMLTQVLRAPGPGVGPREGLLGGRGSQGPPDQQARQQGQGQGPGRRR